MARPSLLRTVGGIDDSAHSHGKHQVLIVGGGVAALETLLALNHLAKGRVQVTMLAPDEDFVYRPMKVAEPFARGQAHHYNLKSITGEHGAHFIAGSFARLHADRQVVLTDSGEELGYDSLVLAVGARPQRSLSRALTFGVERDPEMFNGLLADIEQGYAKRVAFVVPAGTSWSLPLYELALMTAWQAYGMCMDLAIGFYTPEDKPLAIFGARASEAVGQLLAGAHIDLHTGVYVREAGNELIVEPEGRLLRMDRVVALPTLAGPNLVGVPSDADGFIAAAPGGNVTGLDDVYAAGDGADFPVKQGGLATQQADAIAEMIAAAAGADVDLQPFRPVLRGMLLTGDRAQYMRFAVAGGDGDGSVSGHCLWWPPTKIAGRYLAPYLTGRDGEDLHPPEAAEHKPMSVEIRFPQQAGSQPALMVDVSA